MKHEYVTVVYAWVVKCIEGLKDGFISGVPLKQTNVTRRGTQSNQALNCGTAISKWIVRAQLRRGYYAMEPRCVERPINDLAPKVL